MFPWEQNSQRIQSRMEDDAIIDESAINEGLPEEEEEKTPEKGVANKIYDFFFSSKKTKEKPKETAPKKQQIRKRRESFSEKTISKVQEFSDKTGEVVENVIQKFTPPPSPSLGQKTPSLVSTELPPSPSDLKEQRKKLEEERIKHAEQEKKGDQTILNKGEIPNTYFESTNTGEPLEINTQVLPQPRTLFEEEQPPETKPIITSPPRNPIQLVNQNPKEKGKREPEAYEILNTELGNLVNLFNQDIVLDFEFTLAEKSLAIIITDFGNLLEFLPQLRGFNNLINEEAKDAIIMDAYNLMVGIYQDLKLLAPNIEYEYINKETDIFPERKIKDSLYMTKLVKIFKGDIKGLSPKAIESIKKNLEKNANGYDGQWNIVKLSFDKVIIDKETRIVKASVGECIELAYNLLSSVYKTIPNSNFWLDSLCQTWELIYNQLEIIFQQARPPRHLPTIGEFVRLNGPIVNKIKDEDRDPSWDKVLYEKSLKLINNK